MRYLRSISILFVVCISCVEEFYPTVSPDAFNLLVVDGYIDLGGIANVKLSRSRVITEASNSSAEIGASVTISSSKGEMFELSETTPGVYTASDLPVDEETTYSLHITTNNKEYTSGDVKVYPTPDIDKVYFEVAPSGNELVILVDSRGTENDSRYYLFDCLETYAFHADIRSDYILDKNGVRGRTDSEQIYNCWRDAIQPSTVANTTRLSENVISKHQVASIQQYSNKIQIRYSCLVTKRAISADEYSFRDQLLKSTEQMGSLFDVAPGRIVSNVKSMSDPDEYVLGYFRGQQLKTKRLFIERSELPAKFRERAPTECQVGSTCPIGAPPMTIKNCVSLTALTSKTPIVGWDGSIARWVTPVCGDCTASGGTITKPPFW